jgi:hypothetical protein
MPRARRNRIAEQWDQFARLVFKDTAVSPVQKQEMRRAFYAGADAIMTAIMRDASTDEAMTEDDMFIADDFESEIRDFAERLKKGLA